MWTHREGSTVSPKLFLGEFEQMVLLAILQQGDRAFALEVRGEIEGSAGRQVSRGAFYTTLDRLEKKGLVVWTEESPSDPRRGAPLRRFQVTPAGIAALRESRKALDTLSRGLDGLLERVP
jgi:DNA-binding PadR family transcriptional regulator